MKLLVVFTLSAMLLAAAEGQAKKSGPAPRVVKAIEIPKGAVEKEPGAFYYTDSRGKKWIYYKTPFGVSRREDKPAANEPAKPAETLSDIKAVDDGEYIRFERATPFGVSAWKTKKSDLDEMERKVWDREQARTAPKKD